MGVCASLLDLQPAATLTDAARQRERMDETLLAELGTPHACGLTLLAAPRDAVEAAEVDDDALARVLTIARRTYDYVIVDTFPMFDRIVVAVLDASDRAYIVLEGVVPTLLGGHKLLRLLGDFGYAESRQRIVLNRYARITGGVTPQDVAQRLGRAVDHVLPYDKRVIAAANSGEPLAMQPVGWFGYGKQLKSLVADVEQLRPLNGALSNGHVG
jgi:pilus assembly protein CpaE